MGCLEINKISIMSFLSFFGDFFLKRKLKVKKKTIFFYFKLYSFSELILYSNDAKIVQTFKDKKCCFFSKILKGNNFIKIEKLGSGTFINIAFGILYKFWIKKRKKSFFAQESKAFVLMNFREKANQMIHLISLITGIFNLKIEKKTIEPLESIALNLFSINIVSSMHFLNHAETLKRGMIDVIFINGENFIQEYYLSFIRFRNILAFKNSILQKIFVYGNYIFRENITEKKKIYDFLIYRKFLNLNNYIGNQIVDISSNQFRKIRRLVKVCIKFNSAKLINFFSWGRCYLFCDLLVKVLKKLNISYKKFEVVQIRKKLYLIRKLATKVEYYTCFFPNLQLHSQKNFTVFYDMFRKHSIFVNFINLYTITQFLNLNIYFIVHSDKVWFLKLIKSNILKKEYHRF